MCAPGRRASPSSSASAVARASTASQIALMAAATMRDVAERLKATGTFDALGASMTQADAQRLFADR